MKNTFLSLSIMAAVFCSCSNEESTIEATPTVNAIETTNVEASTEETSRLATITGPSRIRFDQSGTFTAKFDDLGTGQLGDPVAEWFVNGKLVFTIPFFSDNGFRSNFTLSPKDFNFGVGSLVNVAVRQRGQQRKLDKTFRVIRP